MATRPRPTGTPSAADAIAEEMLADIEKDTVDFIANFDDTTDEPIVCPRGSRTC